MGDITRTTGLASIVAWDQTQAEALKSLRESEAFYMVTVSRETGAVTAHAASDGLAAAGFAQFLLAAANEAATMVHKALPVIEEEADEDADEAEAA